MKYPAHLFSWLLLACAQVAGSAEPLSDAQLDAVTAGAAQVASKRSEDLLTFKAAHETARGRRIEIEGAIDVQRARSIDQAALLLQDSAQSNLHSLININAVQSAVNVLVNLNIAIDSNVGQIRQMNLAATPAAALPGH